jgi:DNA invertase Pin-like site-specific DNA recombinase
MLDASRRRFAVVLVWKLDRFGRSLRHLMNTLAEFESLGIAFVSLSDNPGPQHGLRAAHVQHHWRYG